MYAQIFFVTSVRGSGSVPTIFAKCSEGCIAFIKALFFALGFVFTIFRFPSFLKAFEYCPAAVKMGNPGCLGYPDSSVHLPNAKALLSIALTFRLRCAI